MSSPGTPSRMGTTERPWKEMLDDNLIKRKFMLTEDKWHRIEAEVKELESSEEKQAKKPKPCPTSIDIDAAENPDLATPSTRYYCSWIPTDKTVLPFKDMFNSKHKQHDYSKERQEKDGLIRPAEGASARALEKGFSNNHNEFNAEYPIYVVPYIENSETAIADWKQSPTLFWHNVVSLKYDDVAYLIVDGATRRNVCKKLGIEKMATNWLDPRISYAELVHSFIPICIRICLYIVMYWTITFILAVSLLNVQLCLAYQRNNLVSECHRK